MQLIDTHAHIYLDQFDNDIDDVMNRAVEADVSKIFMPNIDRTSIDRMLELEEKFPQHCFPMMGLHPCSVDKHFEKELYLVEEWMNQRRFYGIGEIGTDLHWDKTFWDEQQEALKIQLEWAKQKKWPAILHTRESIDETIEIVSQLNDDNLAGIFHCFTGDISQAEKIIEMGFYLGIGGVSTFKNGGMEEVIENIDMEFMVIETDSPYLAPVPHRGKRNEPEFARLVASRIALLKNMPLEEVIEKTSLNATSIFGIK